MVRSYIRWNDDVHFILGQHAKLDLDSVSSLKQSSSRHIASLGLINLILRKPVVALTPEYCMLNGKAANTNFIVFDLTWQGLDSTNYCTRGEHASWCGWFMIWQQVKNTCISKITSKASKSVKQFFSGFWEKWWNMKHLMDANDDNSLVWTCDIFDIEQ